MIQRDAPGRKNRVLFDCRPTGLNSPLGGGLVEMECASIHLQ